jgi:hypothetical protein
MRKRSDEQTEPLRSLRVFAYFAFLGIFRFEILLT